MLFLFVRIFTFFYFNVSVLFLSYQQSLTADIVSKQEKDFCRKRVLIYHLNRLPICLNIENKEMTLFYCLLFKHIVAFGDLKTYNRG